MSSDEVQIKGGASEFEGAVIAVVLDRIAAEEKAARQGKKGRDNRLSPWVTALQSNEMPFPKSTQRVG